MTKKKLSTLVIITLGLLGANTSWSKDLNELKSQVDNNAIKELERTLPDLNPNSQSSHQVKLRLADLYSEKARNLFQNETQNSSNKSNHHKESSELRKKALNIYEESLSKMNDPERKAQIQLRMASLYNDIGNNKKSVQILDTIVAHPEIPLIYKKQGYIHRGHGYFSSGNFKKASEDLLQGLHNDLSTEDQLLIHYRLGWSYFQLNQLKNAKVQYEKALTLIQNNKTKQGYDIYLDYGILLIKESSTRKQHIDLLIQKAHKDFQDQLLEELATEAFRVARYDLAKPLYESIESNSKFSAYQIGIAKMRLITIQSEKTKFTSSEAFKQLIDISKKCNKEENCSLLKKEIRSFVLQNHRLKKTKPDQDVLLTYRLYLEEYQDEPALFVSAAEVANYLDDHSLSEKFYEKAIRLETQKEVKEQYALSNIARAEAYNQNQSKKNAYLIYLSEGSHKETQNKVEFEIAVIDFKDKKFMDSFERAYRLSTNKSAKKDLRKKSAFLAIDSLLPLNNHQKIDEVSAIYMLQFPEEKNKFKDINETAKTTILVKKTENFSTLGERQQRALYTDLKEVALHSEKNKKQLVQNLIRMGDESKIKSLQIDSLILFLSLKNITSSEKQAALNQLYNLYLDTYEFKKAYQLAHKNQKILGLSQIEIARLADISSNKSAARTLYNQVVSNKKSSLNDKISAAHRLVLISSNPHSEFVKNRTLLNRNQKIYDQILSYLIYLSGDQKLAQFINKKLNPLSQFASLRNLQINEINSHIKNHKPITLKLDPKIINQRKKQLAQLDSKLSQSIEIGYPVTQAAWLLLVYKENNQMALDFGNLRAPKGLQKNEESEFLSELKKLSKPYFEKAEAAKNQFYQIMKNQVSEFMISERKSSRHELTAFFNSEAQLLETVFKYSKQSYDLNEIKKTLSSRKSEWNSFNKNNLSNDNIEFFSQLETQFGNPVLSHFLKQSRANNKKGAML